MPSRYIFHVKIQYIVCIYGTAMAYCCLTVSFQYHLKVEPEIWDMEAKSGLD